MKSKVLTVVIILCRLSVFAQQMTAEDYYVSAFNVMSDMLAGRDSLSIKKAVYFAEWAYYEGNLDYQKDYCNEIDRIVKFVDLFYAINKLNVYRTGKQMALNEYFFRPYSGNGYKPYIYDFENFSIDDKNWEAQFVSKVLKTHYGQCRSLPWLYKILAKEIGADVSLARAPGHCYIVYKDLDNQTPEEWINLELTTHQMHPTFWIKQSFEISDSAVIKGTYMTPLTDIQTVACQMADLAVGYREKFKRYDEFTLYCASCSLEYYPMNPNAWIVRGKSLERLLQEYLVKNGDVVDDYADFLKRMIDETYFYYCRTYVAEETDEMRKFRRKQIIDAQKYTQEKILHK